MDLKKGWGEHQTELVRKTAEAATSSDEGGREE